MPDVEVLPPQNGTVAHDVVVAQNRPVVAPRVYQATNIAMPIVSLEMAIERRKMVLEYIDRMFVDGVDFHEIPGTGRENEPPRKVLSKAGAENLCSFFGLRPAFTVMEYVNDWTGQQHGEPLFYVRYKCQLVRNEETLGDGEGSCSSWESKYRYRWVKEEEASYYGFKVDKLLKRGSFIVEPEFAINRAETSGPYGKPAEYWQQFQDAIANKTAVKVQRKKRNGESMDAWQIGSYVYRIPNPDFADVINTVEKMAQKRALIAAVLIATGISGSFTQDLDDFIEAQPPVGTPPDADAPKQQAEAPKQTQQQPKPEPPKREAPKPEPAKEQPKKDYRPRFAALSKRFGVPTPGEFMASHLKPYWVAYFGVADAHNLPQDQSVYETPISILENLSETGEGEFLADPAAFGKRVSNENAAPAAAAPSRYSISELMGQVAIVRKWAGPQATAEHLKAVGLDGANEADVIAYLRLCTVTKTAKLAITAAKNRKTGVAAVIDLLEKKVGTLESAEVHALEVALGEITAEC